jgi:integrase
MLTGLRRNEASTLRWTDIDLDAKVLSVRAEIAKNKKEHRLPLSQFLFELLSQRRLQSPDSDFVFPGRGGKGHMVDSDYVISGVGRNIRCPFVIHDLRRTFLTTAERLDIPHYVLKRLANHSGRQDVTFGYIVVDVERLRPVMERITAHFLERFGIGS